MRTNVRLQCTKTRRFTWNFPKTDQLAWYPAWANLNSIRLPSLFPCSDSYMQTMAMHLCFKFWLYQFFYSSSPPELPVQMQICTFILICHINIATICVWTDNVRAGYGKISIKFQNCNNVLQNKKMSFVSHFVQALSTLGSISLKECSYLVWDCFSSFY